MAGYMELTMLNVQEFTIYPLKRANPSKWKFIVGVIEKSNGKFKVDDSRKIKYLECRWHYVQI